MKTRLFGCYCCGVSRSQLATCGIPLMKAQSLQVTPTIPYARQEADADAEYQLLNSQTFPRPAVPHTDPTKVAAAMHTGTYNRKVTYVIAHRGYHSSPGCPEVSVCSIKAAYDAGSDGVELDTKQTSTHEIVLGHDFSTGRELNEWGNKPANGNWGPFTFYPSIDPYYYLYTKPPKYLDVNQNLSELDPPRPENPLNVQRVQHPLTDFYGYYLKDQYDIASTSQTQLTLYQALYLIQKYYPMMIWIDIKDFQTLQYAAGVIQDIQSRFGTGTGPIYHIGLKLGSNVVVDASKNNRFYPYGAKTVAQYLELNELNYFWVFGTADLDKIVNAAQGLGIIGTPESLLEQAVDRFCPPTGNAANGCLGVELVHKYYGAPTQALYNHLNSKVASGSGPQLASFQQVLQYQWYWQALSPFEQALANENTIIRADGSCCISLMETLNQSPTFGAESEDDRARWDWNENYFTSITTDEPAKVLSDLQGVSLRDNLSLEALGATARSLPTVLVPDGLYRFTNSYFRGAMYLTAPLGDADSTSDSLDQTQMWYVTNVKDPYNSGLQYVTIRSAKNGDYLSIDESTTYGDGKRVTTIPENQKTPQVTMWRVDDSPERLILSVDGRYLIELPGNRGSSVIAATSKGEEAVWHLIPIKPLLSTTLLTGPTASLQVPSPIGPPGYIFCASEGASCTLPVAGTIAFGTKERYSYRFYDSSSTVTCNTDTFQDPARGAFKSCFYNPEGSLPSGPQNSVEFCAMGDFGICQFPDQTNPTNSVAKIVAYGSAKNGWKYTLGTNFVPCNPAAFGSTSNTYNTRSTNACFLTSYTPAAVPGQISNLTAVPASGNTLIVNWAPANSNNTVITSYEVTWTPTAPSYFCTTGSASVPGDSTAYTISRLCSNSTYTIKVAAVSPGGSGTAASTIAASGGPSRFSWCAAENGDCAVPHGGFLIAFGAAGDYLFQPVFMGTNLISPSLRCDLSSFSGADPAKGVRKGCYIAPLPLGITYSYCAPEGQTCFLDGTVPSASNYPANFYMVEFGVANYNAFATAQSDISCDTNTFGDPKSGRLKSCFSRSFIKCANEGSICSFTNFDWARKFLINYGAGQNFRYVATPRVDTNKPVNIDCDTSTFGGNDPNRGKLKACFIDYGPQIENVYINYQYHWCASDGEECYTPDITGPWLIAHGAFGRYQYVAVSARDRINCGNFNGVDPFPGIPKQCYVKPLFHPGERVEIQERQR